jgi:F5/8 type C domain
MGMRGIIMKLSIYLLGVVLLLTLSACVSRAQAATPITVKTAVPLPIGWGKDLAAGQPIIARAGGITHEGWSNANDAVDYTTPTHRPNGGRWGHNTNGSGGTYEVVDLGAVYQLASVGYSLDWDGAFQNPLTLQVEVSTDNDTWTTVAHLVHRYSTPHVSNHVDVDVAITPSLARYVKFSVPPDGSWNGWGDFFQLRAYAAAAE